MKIAVTAKGAGLGAWIDDDFAHCKQIVVVDEDTRFEAWSNPFNDLISEEAEIKLAQWCVDQQIEALVTKQLSPASISILRNGGVALYLVSEGAVLALVEGVRNGTIKTTSAT